MPKAATPTAPTAPTNGSAVKAEPEPFVGREVRIARRVSTPLILINTPDPGATIKTVCLAISPNNTVESSPTGVTKVQWDVANGFTPISKSDEAWVNEYGQDAEQSPFAAFTKVQMLPENGLAFIHLAGHWLNEPVHIQAVWNLRDVFKANGRTLILLGKQVTLPTELSDDVTVIDEPLPTESELSQIVARQHINAGLTCNAATSSKAVEALRGLSSFAAEQVTAMSLKKSGLDLDRCWERKRQLVEQTPGLKVFRGGESFESIGGCDVIKSFLTRILHGQARPNAVVFIDEIEKMLGGKYDSSGVSQDQLGSLLSYMQDQNAAGVIFIGPPGAAKSAIAKAAGNEVDIPTLQLDLGAAKGSLVGQSERQLRNALKVITAVSNGKSLWIATCNAITDLPPELRRRFTLGTFFFDLPTQAERDAIWSIWTSRYGIECFRQDPTRNDSVSVTSGIPADEGWTGAEIRQCCDIAWRLGCSLIEASRFVVPVSKSAATQLEALRSQADGRFLSASVPGTYERPTKLTSNATTSATNNDRRFDLE